MKILVVRFSAIGDCVMTAWAASALRNEHPDAEIVWAVQERCAPVIDTDLLADRLQVFPRETWKRHRWSPATWIDQVSRYTALRRHKLDVGFDFQGHSKTALCLRLSGCKERFSSRATDALAARLNCPAKLEPEGPHEVELAIALVQSRFDVTMPRKPAMPSLVHEKTDLAEQLRADGPLVTVQAGAGEPDKTYPPERMGQVATELAKSGFQVAVIGGPTDPRLDCPGAADFVGRLSLRQSLALVAMSSLHVAADTGTGHAAAAYGVRTVSLFGRTDPDRFRPWGNVGVVLRRGTAMEQIDPNDVVSAVQGLVPGASHASPH